MSARFFKIFSGVFLAHVVVISLVWVGFSAPLSRPPATFTYEGSLPVEDADSWAEGSPFGREGAGPLTSDQVTFDHLDTPSFNHWTTLRESSKPLTYDHLGF